MLDAVYKPLAASQNNGCGPRWISYSQEQQISFCAAVIKMSDIEKTQKTGGKGCSETDCCSISVSLSFESKKGLHIWTACPSKPA